MVNTAPHNTQFFCWQILSTKGFNTPSPPPKEAKSQSLCCKTDDTPRATCRKDNAINILHAYTPERGLQPQMIRHSLTAPVGFNSALLFFWENYANSFLHLACFPDQSPKISTMIVFFLKQMWSFSKALPEEPILIIFPNPETMSLSSLSNLPVKPQAMVILLT